MSNHSRDYDKIIAILKSVAAPCDSNAKNLEHSWRKCRHCLALQELELMNVRKMLSAFIVAVEIGDRDYGKVNPRP
jgi:hypothetical protein